MKKIILIKLMILLVSLQTALAQCPADAGLDNSVCGGYDTLHAISVYGGYWVVTDVFTTETNCSAVFSNHITGEPDIFDPNAIVSVTCEGVWTFTWHEINGACEETDDVEITFHSNPITLTSLPEQKTCLDYAQVNIDTTEYVYDTWYWAVDPDWAYIYNVHVYFNGFDSMAYVHRDFDDSVFGDSGHVTVPLIVTFISEGCASIGNHSVTFYQAPDNAFLVDTIISGNTITLNMTPTSENNSAEWGYADGSYLPYPDDQFYYDFVFSDYGYYGVAFSETNPLGDSHSSCTISDTVIIDYTEVPPLNFSFLVDTSQLNMPFSLNNMSISNTSELSGSYLWSVYQGNNVNADNLLYQTNDNTPDYNFPNAGIYFITLAIENNKSLNSISKYSKLNIREAGTNIDEIPFEKLIYPNPTTGKIYVEASQFESIEIYNQIGTLIKSSKKRYIDLSHEEKGIYFIKVISNTSTTIQKLILE